MPTLAEENEELRGLLRLYEAKIRGMEDALSACRCGASRPSSARRPASAATERHWDQPRDQQLDQQQYQQQQERDQQQRHYGASPRSAGAPSGPATHGHGVRRFDVPGMGPPTHVSSAGSDARRQGAASPGGVLPTVSGDMPYGSADFEPPRPPIAKMNHL
jgi:sRNA-binding protein